VWGFRQTCLPGCSVPGEGHLCLHQKQGCLGEGVAASEAKKGICSSTWVKAFIITAGMGWRACSHTGDNGVGIVLIHCFPHGMFWLMGGLLQVTGPAFPL
jgi:hypothetical protein